MSIHESLKLVPYQGHEESANFIGIVELDLVAEKVNKFNLAVMMRLKEIIEEIRRSSYRIIIVTSKKSSVFIAGADIDEIKSMSTKEEFSKAIDSAHEIFNALEELPIPVMAAIHGACMGGGTEFAMACDYRLATDDASTRIGLPEIQLGILPGFGGCVRMPRIIGLQASLDIILAGKSVAGKKALKIGLVDRLVHPSILLEHAVSWAIEILKEGGAKRKKIYRPKSAVDKFLESWPGKQIVFKKAHQGVLKATKGHYPAPLKALEVIRRTYGMRDRNAALKIERDGFCELAITEVSKNLIHVFYLTEMVKKRKGVAEDSNSKVISNLGILGAGTMGGGIAYVAADKGIAVRIKDLNVAALGKAMKHASDLWKKLFKKKILDKYQIQQRLDRVTTTTSYSGFGNLDLVIEAIVEDLGIKKKVVGETSAHCRPDCIMVTNTSSLSVSEISQGHPHPENFAGMHFFNPVDKMPLVEVIRGEKTNANTIATVYDLAKKMGKMPVVVKDGPGFLVNRILLPYMSEAAHLLQDGMSAAKVDAWFVDSIGMPMGPFALMDEVGLDVCIKVLKIFRKAFGERIESAPCLDSLEKSGRLGKKNGKGFYHYDEDGKRLHIDESIYSVLGLPSPIDNLTEKECLERCLFAMINESAMALLQDHIVESPHEVDLAMIMGTGFPPFRGGLLKYADSLGTAYIADQLESYALHKKSIRLKPSMALSNLAKNGRKFY